MTRFIAIKTYYQASPFFFALLSLIFATTAVTYKIIRTWFEIVVMHYGVYSSTEKYPVITDPKVEEAPVEPITQVPEVAPIRNLNVVEDVVPAVTSVSQVIVSSLPRKDLVVAAIALAVESWKIAYKFILPEPP